MFKWIGLVVLSLMLPVSVAHAQKKGSLTPSDYEEIRGLYAKYAFGFDTGDAALVGSVYAADGTFVVGGRVMGDSREKITAIVKAPGAGKPAMKHMPTNILIEPSDEGARGRSYVALVTFQEGKAPAVTGGGFYADIIVKTADGWRFKRRDYQPFPAGAPAPAPAPAP